jgi:hypothetical protein
MSIADLLSRATPKSVATCRNGRNVLENQWVAVLRHTNPHVATVATPAPATPACSDCSDNASGVATGKSA